MWRLADQQLDEFVADGRCEFISAYAQPFAMLVVADLLGVPEDDHQRFREGFGLSGNRRRGRRGRAGRRRARTRSAWLDERFARLHRGPPARAARRRAHRPRARDLPRRHHARRHHGRAHGDVPVRRRPGDDRAPARRRAEAPRRAPRAPGRAARATASCIPNFLEEVLRIESPVKADFRLARRATTVGGVDIAAGTPVMLLNGAANRDPRRFECPARVPDRPAERAGAHRVRSRQPLVPRRRRSPGPRAASASSASSTACATSGSPRSTTARRATRRFGYEPTWILRGLTELHLEFTPWTGGRADGADRGHRGDQAAEGAVLPHHGHQGLGRRCARCSPTTS